MQESKTFFIGELSLQSGLSRDTIQYYEGVGVLPEARRSTVSTGAKVSNGWNS